MTLARWFHHQGIAWSGTPAELASELSRQNGHDTHAGLSDPEEVVAVLEANIEALRELGVEASIRKPAGRPRIITLQTAVETVPTEHAEAVSYRHQDSAYELRTRDEVNEPPASPEAFFEALKDEYEEAPKDEEAHEQPTEDLSLHNHVLADESAATMLPTADAPLEPATRPFEFLGLSDAYEPAYRDEDEDLLLEEDLRPRRWRRLLFIVIALLLALASFAFVRGDWRKMISLLNRNPSPTTNTTDSSEGRATSQQPSSDAADPATEQSSTTNNKGLAATPSPTKHLGASPPTDVSQLSRDARAGNASAQYELGRRYAEGRGVEPDRVAAYVWLVLARSNGFTRSDSLLRKLDGELSPTELQQVRLMLGRSYAEGAGVGKDNVAAHSWYSLAEVAGSAEATVLKKRLEDQMTPAEIDEAKTRTTEWLSRH